MTSFRNVEPDLLNGIENGTNNLRYENPCTARKFRSFRTLSFHNCLIIESLYPKHKLRSFELVCDSLW